MEDQAKRIKAAVQSEDRLEVLSVSQIVGIVQQTEIWQAGTGRSWLHQRKLRQTARRAVQTAVAGFSIHRVRIRSLNHFIVNHIDAIEPCRDLDTIMQGERSWAGNVPNLTKLHSPRCYFYAPAEIAPTLAVPGELFCMEAFSRVRSKKARSMIQQTCQSRGSAGSAILRTALAGRRHPGDA